MTGKKLSSETKEKIKFANKGRKLSEAHKAKLRKAKLRASSHKGKKVYCPQLNKVFESIMQVSRELKLSDGNICSCCKGKRKTCGGFHFEFYTEE